MLPDALISPVTAVQQPPWRRWFGHWGVVCIAIAMGAVLVGLTLRVPRGSVEFYVAGYALALVWIGAWAIGEPRRTCAVPDAVEVAIGTGIGVAAFGAFVCGAAIGRHISVLQGPIDNVLARADAGPLAAVLGLALVNAVAEELFFRGLVIERAAGMTVRACAVLALLLYVGVTAVAGNTALTVAAVVMGAVFVAVRLWRKGLTVPITVHVVWSTLMLLALPR